VGGLGGKQPVFECVIISSVVARRRKKGRKKEVVRDHAGSRGSRKLLPGGEGYWEI